MLNSVVRKLSLLYCDDMSTWMENICDVKTDAARVKMVPKSADYTWGKEELHILACVQVRHET